MQQSQMRRPNPPIRPRQSRRMDCRNCRPPGRPIRCALWINARGGSTPSAPRSPRRKARWPIHRKGAVNPHFKSQYADLSAGLNAIRAALSANGIAIVQQTRMDDDMLMLHTMLSHASGQWIGSLWPVVKLPAAPQVDRLGVNLRSPLHIVRACRHRWRKRRRRRQCGFPQRRGRPADRRRPACPDPELLAETKSNVGVFFLTLGCVGFSDMTVPQYRKGLALLNEKKRRMAMATP